MITKLLCVEQPKEALGLWPARFVTFAAAETFARLVSRRYMHFSWDQISGLLYINKRTQLTKIKSPQPTRSYGKAGPNKILLVISHILLAPT